ncbi:uncharacterized protein Pyn_10188 [Prunus yedoensis var. nudiflora]|uniref:Large ribosomal subunit protein bL32m n=2 Tax=Prunus TaxID=3754 RepID=A0A314YL63_PRUYE|nr:uncharacterized protein LOC110754020 [Prunus avium]PQQ09315.1 uncharacterized protein Pyn_10188 [Prunus yedoensis var. nudiflora]
MASMMALLRSSRGNMACVFGTKRWNHVAAMPPPFDGVMERKILSPQLVLPESDRDPAQNNNIGFGFPSFLFGGSMELMAVPKRKTSPHKRGIRNGPKALKPVPVIIRCRACGRVKLPHFFCCSGDRGNGHERDGSTS